MYCTEKKGFLKTKKQLKKWKVRYHELIMGKPSYDILIDDKSLNFNKNWSFEIDKKIKMKLKIN